MRIELNSGVKVFTGRSMGRRDRDAFQLGRLDSSAGHVIVVVPSQAYTMTSSYFLEVFGPSIRALGRDAFLLKYEIQAPDHIKRKIDDWISRALREKRGLLGGDE